MKLEWAKHNLEAWSSDLALFGLLPRAKQIWSLMLLSLPEELLVTTLNFLPCFTLTTMARVCRALRALWKIPRVSAYKKKLTLNITILQMVVHTIEDRAGRFKNLHNSSFASYMLDPYVKYSVQCLRPLGLIGHWGPPPPVWRRPPRGKPPPGKRLCGTGDMGWYLKI